MTESRRVARWSALWCVALAAACGETRVFNEAMAGTTATGGGDATSGPTGDGGANSETRGGGTSNTSAAGASNGAGNGSTPTGGTGGTNAGTVGGSSEPGGGSGGDSTGAGGAPEGGAAGDGGDGSTVAGAGGDGSTASADPCAALEATAADFGVLTCQMYWPITLYNPTEDLIAITTPTLAGSIYFYGGDYPGNEGTCAGTLAPGETCVLDILIEPEIPFGTQSVDLSIEYSRSCGMRTLVVPFRGEFQRPAQLAFREASLDFGATTTEKTDTVTVINEGDREATDVNSVTTTNSAFDYTGGIYPGSTLSEYCTDKLAAGASCKLSLTFTPDAGAGDYTGSLRFGFDDGCFLSEIELPLLGEGL